MKSKEKDFFTEQHWITNMPLNVHELTKLFDGRLTNCRPSKSVQIGNLDFLLAPKCATNTIRYASYIYNGGTATVNDIRDDSYDVLKLGNKSIIPYLEHRDNALKIAIKRDPVERFISAISWYNGKYNENVSVDQCIEEIPDDIHFWPQTCFYGLPSQFNHIITADTISTLIKNITDKDLGVLHKGKSEYPRPVLTDSQIASVKEMYTADYVNGYC